MCQHKYPSVEKKKQDPETVITTKITKRLSHILKQFHIKDGELASKKWNNPHKMVFFTFNPWSGNSFFNH
jgi:hypothetical protein